MLPEITFRRVVLGLASAAVAGLLALGADGAKAQSTQDRWTIGWGSVAVRQPARPGVAPVKGTLRYRMTLHAPGHGVRVRITNEFGAVPLRITAASVARAGPDDALLTPVTPLTFSGATLAEIPVAAPLVSDTAPMVIRTGDQIVVSLYVPEGAPAELGGIAAVRPVEVIEDVDATRSPEIKGSRRPLRSLVTQVQVQTRRPRGSIITLGDSITEGRGTVGWPDLLAARTGRELNIGVVNAGIGGNRLLTSNDVFGESALARLDRDLLSVPDARFVIVAEGINDIGLPGSAYLSAPDTVPDAAQLIFAYRQIISRARGKGLKVIGGTITPSKGAIRGYWNPDKEKIRQAVNAWIRTSREFDGVIDFDAAVRDPQVPEQLNAVYDSGDHLHPNSTGLEAMAKVIDLRLFR